jgi:hypothetical protein
MIRSFKSLSPGLNDTKPHKIRLAATQHHIGFQDGIGNRCSARIARRA